MTPAGKKEKKAEGHADSETMRDDAEQQLAHSPIASPGFAGQTAEKLIHELQVHQIELETQAEELRRAHLALEESRDKYLDLYEFAPIGYLTLDNKARVTGANLTSAMLLGIERSSFIGVPFSKCMSEKESDRWYRYFMNVLKQQKKETCILTLSLLRGDGSVFPARLEGIRITDSSKGTPTVRVAISDITGILQAEQALRIANKKLSLLSGITRHDINNQLQVLQGYLALLDQKKDDPRSIEFFQRINDAALRISVMIRFTKEYDSIGVNAPVWQDCCTLVDIAARQAPLGKVRVKNDLPAGTEVFADPLAGKVCYNLMDNAVRYGGKITTIRFSGEERNGDHIVVCEDDGVGIVAEEKEKIFERGFGKNTGLGLALSREILDITGITIRETGEPGRGARFEITAPKGTWRMAEREP